MTTRITTYSSHGRYVFVVPDQCTSIDFDVKGGGGGGVAGGAGGRVQGTLAVTPGDTLYIRVGEQGYAPSDGPGHVGGAGGYPNAGAGGDSTNGAASAGGGGASSVRRNTDDLGHLRFMAGGGGGRGGNGTAGGNGGGTTGQAGTDGGHAGSGGAGGTSGAGGAHGTNSPGTTGTSAQDGASNSGGNGSTTTSAGDASGGGGGGGYFGGGGGGRCGGLDANTGGGGGGGSNFADGAATAVTHTRGGGAAATTDGSVKLTYNVAPSQPVATYPVAGYDVDDTAGVFVKWSDPDGSGTTADVRWSVGGGAWHDIIGAIAGSFGFYTFAPSTFTAYLGQTVSWCVRLVDGLGATGDWSDPSTFIPRAEPAAATITPAPIINSNTPNLAWTTPSPMTCYQLRVCADLAGAPDVALVTGPIVVLDGPLSARSAAMPNYAYVEHTDYHLEVRWSQYTNGPVWSPWADSGAIEALIDAPLQPTLVLTPFPDTASVLIAITNPGSDPYPPNYNDVFRQNLDDGSDELRVATGVAVNGTYVDTTPAAATLRYRVNAVNNTTYTSSE